MERHVLSEVSFAEDSVFVETYRKKPAPLPRLQALLLREVTQHEDCVGSDRVHPLLTQQHSRGANTKASRFFSGYHTRVVIVLHNIRSVQNVASIFRTADGVGVEKIYLCGITPGPLDRLGHSRVQFIKVSLGAEKNVPYEKKTSTVRTIEGLRKDGYQIVSVEQAKNSIPHYQFKIGKRKTALVLGSEVAGLPAPILKKSDKILEIPMEGKKESLNVAVAFGIVAYALKYK